MPDARLARTREAYPKDRPVNSRLQVLLRRLTQWDAYEGHQSTDVELQKATTLLLDIKQCLESILLYDNR